MVKAAWSNKETAWSNVTGGPGALEEDASRHMYVGTQRVKRQQLSWLSSIQPSISSSIIKVGKQQQHSTVLFDWRGRGLDQTDESSSSHKGTVMIGCVANKIFSIDIANVPRFRAEPRKLATESSSPILNARHLRRPDRIGTD